MGFAHLHVLLTPPVSETSSEEHPRSENKGLRREKKSRILFCGGWKQMELQSQPEHPGIRPAVSEQLSLSCCSRRKPPAEGGRQGPVLRQVAVTNIPTCCCLQHGLRQPRPQRSFLVLSAITAQRRIRQRCSQEQPYLRQAQPRSPIPLGRGCVPGSYQLQ